MVACRSVPRHNVPPVMEQPTAHHGYIIANYCQEGDNRAQSPISVLVTPETTYRLACLVCLSDAILVLSPQDAHAVPNATIEVSVDMRQERRR